MKSLLFLVLFSYAFCSVVFVTMNDDNVYQYNVASGALERTINIPTYNGTTTPLLTGIMHQLGSQVIWMVDKGTSVFQSMVSFDLSTATVTVGGYFPSSFQFSTGLWEGGYITDDGLLYGLIRTCSGTCTMSYYRLDGYNVTNAVINVTLIWNIANLAFPGWRGWAIIETDHPVSYHTMQAGQIYLISPTSGVLETPLPNSPATNLQTAYAFDLQPLSSNSLIFFRSDPTYANTICTEQYTSGFTSCTNVTYPGVLRPITLAYYAGIPPVASTGPITSGGMTTAPLTTASVSTASVSTGSISTGAITTAPVIIPYFFL